MTELDIYENGIIQGFELLYETLEYTEHFNKMDMYIIDSMKNALKKDIETKTYNLVKRTYNNIYNN